MTAPDREFLERLASARLEGEGGLLSRLTLQRYFMELDTRWPSSVWSIVLPGSEDVADHEKLRVSLRSARVVALPIGVDIGIIKEGTVKLDHIQSLWGMFAIGALRKGPHARMRRMTGTVRDSTTRDLDFWLDESRKLWNPTGWVAFRYFPLSVPEGILMQNITASLIKVEPTPELNG